MKANLLRISSSSSSSPVPKILMQYLLNSSSFFTLCSLISLTLGSEFHYIPTSTFRRHHHSSPHLQSYQHPHQSQPYLYHPYHHHPQSRSLQAQANQQGNKRPLQNALRLQVPIQQDFPIPSAFPKIIEDLRKDYVQSLFNKIPTAPSSSLKITNSSAGSASSKTSTSSTSGIQTRRLDLATRPREARRGIVDDVQMDIIELPARKAASPALPFLQMNDETNGLKSSFSSRFLGSHLQAENERQPDDVKNEIIDVDGGDGWKVLLGPTIQPTNSTNKNSTSQMLKNSKDSKLSKIQKTSGASDKAYYKSNYIKKDPVKRLSTMSHYPKDVKSKKLPKIITDSKTSSVTSVSKSISRNNDARIGKVSRDKVPKIGINRSTSHVIVSKRIGSKSSNKSSSTTTTSSKTISSGMKSNTVSTKPFNATTKILTPSKQTPHIPFHSVMSSTNYQNLPEISKFQNQFNERPAQNSRSLQPPPTTMLTLDPNSLIIKPSLQIYTQDLEDNRIEPVTRIIMDPHQISYFQHPPLLQHPQPIPYLNHHDHHQYEPLQRNPYTFIRDPFEIVDSARMAPNKNYFFKGEDSDENIKDDGNERLPIIDPQHPVVQNALNPLGNPAKEPDQLNKKTLRILDPSSLIPLNKTYVYIGMTISWIVFFVAAFSYHTWAKDSKGGAASGGHVTFADKLGQAQTQEMPLIFNMPQVTQDGTTIFTKRALDTNPGSRWNFTKVLEYIDIAQKTYEGFEWQNLECQKRVLCELAQKDNWAGETGRKITNDYLLTMVDAISGVPFPRLIQAILTEYKEAISQGKNSTKECGAVYNKCKFSIKEVIAQAGQKRKQNNF